MLKLTEKGVNVNEYYSSINQFYYLKNSNKYFYASILLENSE